MILRYNDAQLPLSLATPTFFLFTTPLRRGPVPVSEWRASEFPKMSPQAMHTSHGTVDATQLQCLLMLIPEGNALVGHLRAAARLSLMEEEIRCCLYLATQPLPVFLPSYIPVQCSRTSRSLPRLVSRRESPPTHPSRRSQQMSLLLAGVSPQRCPLLIARPRRLLQARARGHPVRHSKWRHLCLQMPIKKARLLAPGARFCLFIGRVCCRVSLRVECFDRINNGMS